MPVSVASADYMLDQWGTSKAVYVSAHSAYSASGGNEITGGSPAYARLATTWASAAANSKSLSGTYTFNIPASSTVAFIGFWDALTSGNFAGMIPAGNLPAFTFSAPSSSSTLLAPGSAYSATQQVVVFPTGGSTLPSGLTAGVIYYISAPSGDSFKLSATSGGSAITLTSDGSGYVQGITPETFGSQGTDAVTGGTVSLV